VPGPPTALSAAAVSKTQINLAWTPSSAGGQTGFKIERSTDNRTFSQIATVGASAASYPSTQLKANTTYYYRVRAYNNTGNSGYSNVAYAKTPLR